MSLDHLLDSKFIVFTDFDGTITLTDSNDYLTDNVGFGSKRRLELGTEILEGRRSFRRDVSTYNNRDVFKDMLDSVASQKTFEECKALVANRIECDPGFKPFYEWCQSHGIPVVILSSGMEPLIRALLASHVGAAASSAIPIVANDVKHRPDGTWEIVYRDPSHFGHDKSLAIRPFREAREKLPAGDGGRPVYFYCGDGLSDLSAARETDLLFAKQGHALITYCQRENVPYKAFRDFNDILNDVKDVFEGRKTPAEIAENS